jgi:hypothetical protein
MDLGKLETATDVALAQSFERQNLSFASVLGMANHLRTPLL